MSEEIIIGRFGSTFGVDGWIKVNSFTNPHEKILEYNNWLIKKDGIWQPVNIEKKQLRGKHILVKIVGFNSPEVVKIFASKEIVINKQSLPILPKGEYYWNELIGLAVFNKEGIDLGIVTGLIETGSNDVLVVKQDRERLIPYLSFVVYDVDLKNKKIIVDWGKDF